jgi:transcriptional regulator with XRE-family HTH domain
MLDFGKRLREERERLRLNQTDFGRIGGVTKTSQFNYEQGERSPNVEYWKAIAEIGADVAYILTGTRAQPPETAKAQAEPQEEPASEDPLARRKVKVKRMMDQIVDRISDARGLDEIQLELSKIERIKDLEQEVAELRQKAG